MLIHHFNVFCIRYGLSRLQVFCWLAVVLAIVCAVYVAPNYWDRAVLLVNRYVQAIDRAHRAELAVAEMGDVLSGKVVMVEPVGEKMAKVGRVSIDWQLVELHRGR